MDSTKLLILLWFLATIVAAKNIIMVVVDDLDLVLDGMKPLNNIRNLIGNQGATYTNCFVASPICCPNRASILTGRYQHNHKTFNNSIQGGCNSRQWQSTFEPTTFAAHLKRQGYNTFYAGKYLNQYGSKEAGGTSHRPLGWDWWAGLVGNSRYYDYSLSINGTERRYGNAPDHYLTDVIKKMSINFINGPRNYQAPFLMVLAPPAPHAPYTPASRHNDIYKQQKAKKTKNFNTQSQDKHWLVRTGQFPLSIGTLTNLDNVYRRRWETLLSVDELVRDVVSALQAAKVLDNTYIIFTSDNGYHIGQFSMPLDKRQPYETDIRVPLLIRGPGIQPGSQIDAPVSSVDLFATILEMGGTEQESDGTSMLQKNISSDRTLLIEYKGEHSKVTQNTGCPSDLDLNVTLCGKNLDCKCQDAANNTYSCIRRFSKDHNNLFCVFEDSQRYMEAYDFNEDPYQMKNIAYSMNKGRRHRFRRRLHNIADCKGTNCVTVHEQKKS